MKTHKQKIWGAVLIVCMITIVWVVPVLAQGITIDGDFTDWDGKAALVDPGGADDERSPSTADITEFRADADGSGLYLLKAWDDTDSKGGQEITAGITVKAADNSYYRIYTTAGGQEVLTDSLKIYSCGEDSTCSSQTEVCTGSGCSGAAAGSGPTWDDPFSGRTSPDCYGTDCGTKDLAVELYIPWDIVGGAPGNGQFIFLQFGSYPSGPGQAPKDDTGPNGIACRNNNGTFECYKSTPTVVTLKSFSASSATNLSQIAGIILAGIVLMTAIGAYLRRFYQSRTEAG